jgi:2,4-dienoyl-CoA reductase-like NADH-dependent reductase (Old Yellow Enzyme family)
MPDLFSPLSLRSLTLRNRVAVAPMCMYSSTDGLANDFHLVHLGSRASGGAGLIVVEASAVTPDGRITYADMGIWGEAHVEPLSRIVRFVESQGAAIGIQLAHAGRKAGTDRPVAGGKPVASNDRKFIAAVAPSAVPFDSGYQTPRELSSADLDRLVTAWADAAKRAVAAGFKLIEIHAAHGYLLHEFLSPLSNRRTDDFGGSFENRVRFPLRVVDAVRATIPDSMPLLVRISATDWKDGGWDVDQSVEFARRAKPLGVDLIDVSSGGLVPDAKIAAGPLYQTPFAERIRREAGIATGAVGLIRTATEAQSIVAGDRADLVLLAREELRNPYWPIHAAIELGATPPWPEQYGYAVARRP